MVSVHVALNNVKSAIGAVKKQEQNRSQGFNFRGIDAVVNAAAPALNEHGVVVCPYVISHVYETVEIGKARTPMAHVTLNVAYRFYGPEGDYVESLVFSEAMDSGDKAAAKAMSVAYRIALLQTLNLPTDEPDPDSVSYERSVREVQAAAPPPDYAALIRKAVTVDALRDTWKLIGSQGGLKTEILVDGEKIVTEDFLYRRHDELAAAKSS